MAEDPQRPAVLCVGDDSVWEQLRPHLQEVHVKLETGTPLTLLDGIMEEMMQHLSAAQEALQAVPLLEVPGVGLPEAGSFYEAAAYFYNAAPWAAFDNEGAVRCTVRNWAAGRGTP